jgi:hypothetical protein
MLQSQSARALDNEEYVISASLDLSSAFDPVKMDLPLKSLKIAGLPDDMNQQIEFWLKDKFSLLAETNQMLRFLSLTRDSPWFNSQLSSVVHFRIYSF